MHERPDRGIFWVGLVSTGLLSSGTAMETVEIIVLKRSIIGHS